MRLAPKIRIVLPILRLCPGLTILMQAMTATGIPQSPVASKKSDFAES
jgi:hypothetical protein